MEIQDELARLSHRIRSARDGEIVPLKCEASCLLARFDEVKKLGESYNIKVITLKPIPYVTN
jgi:hypothetical protein